MILMTLTTILFIPSFLLSLAAGYMYGYLGIVVVIVCVTFGSTISFLIGKVTLKRTWMEALSNKKIEAIDRALSKHTFKILLLFRLIPVTPFNFLNYFIGMTNIQILPFIGATFLGMIPETVILVHWGTFGKSIRSIVSGASGPGWTLEIFTYLISGVIVVIVFVYVVNLARRELTTMISREQELEQNNVEIEVDGPQESEPDV
jgi:uncharacterized membrane protein YdjX (TVP38/TMEM64 family)